MSCSILSIIGQDHLHTLLLHFASLSLKIITKKKIILAFRCSKQSPSSCMHGAGTSVVPFIPTRKQMMKDE